MTITQNLIFDLDDTLVECGIFYRQQQHKFIEYQTARTGLPTEIIKNLRDEIDLNFTKLPDGFNRDRFPRSFAACSVALDAMLGNRTNQLAADFSFGIGDDVFNESYPLCDGVDELLESYSTNGHKLFLLTKGDTLVQTKKIILNDLHRWFEEDKIHIVPQKNADTLRNILTIHNLNITNTTVIGDSLRDDMAPALLNNCHTVWVSGRHNRQWAYENTTTEVDYEITNVTDLPQIIHPETGFFTKVG